VPHEHHLLKIRLEDCLHIPLAGHLAPNKHKIESRALRRGGIVTSRANAGSGNTHSVQWSLPG
jgi:hypothetical protein